MTLDLLVCQGGAACNGSLCSQLGWLFTSKAKNEFLCTNVGQNNSAMVKLSEVTLRGLQGNSPANIIASSAIAKCAETRCHQFKGDFPHFFIPHSLPLKAKVTDNLCRTRGCAEPCT